MDDALENGVIGRTRFVIIDGDKSVLDKVERYLLLQAAPKVYTVTSPLHALRIMQDRRTPVDCVICPNKDGRISGLEFLQNLRLGRWSGPNLRNVKFILMMKHRDDAAIQLADGFRVSGYIIGELDRDTVTNAVVKALTQSEADSPLRKYPVAHLRYSGVDAIFVPFEPAVGEKSIEEQQRAISALQSAAAVLRVGGIVVPAWETDGGRTGFVAAPEYHSTFSDLTLQYILRNLNRELSTGEDIPRSAIDSADHANSAELPATHEDDGRMQPSGGSGPERAPAEPAAQTPRRSTHAPARTGDEANFSSAVRDPASNREIAYEDLNKIVLAFKQLGPENFAKAFMRNQSVVRKPHGKPVTSITREYFYSLNLLRKALFPDVNLRKCGQIFGELTLALDQVFMRSFEHFPKLNAPFSINLNVQSIFTKSFEGFLDSAPHDSMTIEFRQPNIVEYYDEFVTARALLESKGVRIAVDNIYSDTIGLVNLDYIGASMAKIHWTKGSEDILQERSKALRHYADSGVKIVMTRVDETVALRAANQVGIEKFQGFLIDELVKNAAA